VLIFLNNLKNITLIIIKSNFLPLVDIGLLPRFYPHQLCPLIFLSPRAANMVTTPLRSIKYGEKSQIHSPIVNNHSEQKRGKPHMVINCKRLNELTIFDGYFLPNKELLINKTLNKKWFSKFDCKYGFYQIKLKRFCQTINSIQYSARTVRLEHHANGIKECPTNLTKKDGQHLQCILRLLSYIC